MTAPRYVAAADVKAWSDVDASVRDHDRFLNVIIPAAENHIDAFCHRTFDPPTGTATARIFPGHCDTTFVDDAADITLVEHSNDRITWSTFGGTWWRGPDSERDYPITIETTSRFARFVRATGDWGFVGGPPDEVKLAVQMRSAQLLERRNTIDGIAGGTDFGIRISRHTDPDIAALLQRWWRADREGIG